jgi:hypothetical protein
MFAQVVWHSMKCFDLYRQKLTKQTFHELPHKLGECGCDFQLIDKASKT